MHNKKLLIFIYPFIIKMIEFMLNMFLIYIFLSCTKAVILFHPKRSLHTILCKLDFKEKNLAVVEVLNHLRICMFKQKEILLFLFKFIA